MSNGHPSNLTVIARLLVTAGLAAVAMVIIIFLALILVDELHRSASGSQPGGPATAPASPVTTIAALSTMPRPTAGPTDALTKSQPALAVIQQGEAAVLKTPNPAITPDVGLVSPTAISTEAVYRRSLGEPERPRRIRIPAIDVDTMIEEVGLKENGAMATPEDWMGVGWYSLGYTPGQAGNAVMTGHLDAPRSREAIFWRLHELRPGDQVFIETENGRSLVFEVEISLYYPYDSAPLSYIFGPADEPRLNLITCLGEWDRAEQTYDRRLVVYTRQVGAYFEERDGSLPSGMALPSGSP